MSNSRRDPATSTPRHLHNPHARDVLSAPAPDRAPLAFHRQLSGYAPTPLIDAPALAVRLGVGRVSVKDESERLGLPAFKVLGASWANYRALQAHLGGDFQPNLTLDALRQRLEPLHPLTLAAATDGNHGRAVARMARWLGLAARIYVPAEMVPARREAIAAEGATVVVVEGTYDEAVAQAGAAASERCLVIADTAWPGYEDVPRWVIDGYSTIFWEVDDTLQARGVRGPDLVIAQIGVGAFAAAVTRHYRRVDNSARPQIVGVEPADAACALASVAAGQLVAVPGPHRSIMAGLNCGLPSLVAWPTLLHGISVYLAIEDDWAREAMRALAEVGVVAGESGAAGLGGLLALAHSAGLAGLRETLGIDEHAHLLLFNSEGATDPDAYAQIVGAGRS